MYPDLLRYVLPSEVVDYFELVDLQSCGNGWHDHTTAANRVAWTAANDPCPQGWCVPTQQQLQSLNNAGSILFTYSGVRGLLLALLLIISFFLPQERVPTLMARSTV